MRPYQITTTIGLRNANINPPLAAGLLFHSKIASLSNRKMGSSAKAVSKLLSDELNWEAPFIYGTAWKKDMTKQLVQVAIAKGFRKVDTAAQPKHYQEPLVGDALRDLFRTGTVKREDIYVSIDYIGASSRKLTISAANEVHHTCWSVSRQHAL